jgi:two-component sensor histidine kinase
MVTEVSASGDRVRVRRTGSFGVLPSDSATALAMVLTEVLQNAVEHGYPADGDASGVIVVSARRLVGRLHVTIEDNGRGLPEDFDADRSTHLGLSIVRTLVESELGGVMEIGEAHGQAGARVSMDVPLD